MMDWELLEITLGIDINERLTLKFKQDDQFVYFYLAEYPEHNFLSIHLALARDETLFQRILDAFNAGFNIGYTAGAAYGQEIGRKEGAKQAMEDFGNLWK